MAVSRRHRLRVAGLGTVASPRFLVAPAWGVRGVGHDQGRGRTKTLQTVPRRKKHLTAAELIDPVESAKAAGLKYVLDVVPGIRRKRAGKGFYYLAPDGARVRDAETLKRIRSLVIPPAWRDVWISPDARSHLQATGLDDRNRKQYRYHPHWREVRDAVKYDRMAAFAQALPAIRERTDRDLGLPGMPREKVLAAVVQLLESTRVRIGNEEYRRDNRSFGLTTLQDRHVEVVGSRVRFKFKGKAGKKHDIEITNRRLARVIKRSQEIPGQQLFQYLDDDGSRETVESGDVNQYLREISGGDFTAKDFRTWSGSVLAAAILSEVEPAESERERKKQVAAVVDRVAEQLGNTPTVCRKCYVHPVVVDTFMAGVLRARVGDEETGERGDGGTGEFGLTEAERTFVRLLESEAATPVRKAA